MIARIRCRIAQLRGADAERGSGAVFVVFFALVVLSIAALVIDGGNAITMRQQAANEAGEAARKVAGDVSVPDIRAGTITIDADQCWKDADQVISAYGQGSVTACTVAGRDVTVTVAITYHPILLGIVELNLTFTARAVAVAHLAAGITTGS